MTTADDFERIALGTRQSLDAGRWVRLKINGTSMTPIFQPGDDLEVEGQEFSLIRCGDILLVDRGTDMVAHRAIRPFVSGWQTKGDAMLWQDAPGGKILGRVVSFVRGGRRIDLDRPLGRWVQRVLGRVALFECAVYPWFLSEHKNTAGKPVMKPGLSLVRLPFRCVYWVFHFLWR